jgi:hypothetical protein
MGDKGSRRPRGFDIDGPNRLANALDIANRTRDAIRLRIAGMNYAQIGTKLGVDPALVQRDIQAALKSIYQEDGQELVRLENERLNAIMLAAWPACLKGDPKAAATVFGCIDRRLRLAALDKPQSIRLVLERETGALLERLQKELPSDVFERVLEVAAGLEGGDHAGGASPGEGEG